MPRWDPEAPLDPIKGETAKHTTALHRYYLMGSDRSIRNLAEIYEEEKKQRQRGNTSIPAVPTTSQGTLANWSSKFDWVNRCIQQDMLDQAAREREWKERREQVREDDWQHSSQLRNLAQRILDAAPAFVRRTVKIVDDGTPRVVDTDGNVLREGRPMEKVVTVALSVSDLAQIEKLASKLARLAARMDESRHSVTIDWREEAKRAGIEPAQAYEKLVAQLVESYESGSSEPDAGGGSEGGSETDSE